MSGRFVPLTCLIHRPADDSAYGSRLVGERHVLRACALQMPALSAKPARLSLVGAERAMRISILAPRTRRRYPVVLRASVFAVFADRHIAYCSRLGISNASAMMSRSIQN